MKLADMWIVWRLAATFIAWENGPVQMAVLRYLMNKVCIVPATMHVKAHKLRAMEVSPFIFLDMNLVRMRWSTAWKVMNAISSVKDLIRAMTSLPIAMVFALFNAMRTPIVRK